MFHWIEIQDNNNTKKKKISIFECMNDDCVGRERRQLLADYL